MLRPAVTPYPARRKDRVGWFWIDLAVFWVTATAAHYALLVSVYDYAQLLPVALTTAVCVLLSAAICYNRWTVAAGALLPLAGGAVLWGATAVNRGMAREVVRFLPWVARNMFYVDADIYSPYFFVCAAVVMFLLTLLGYVLTFRLRASLAYLGGGLLLCVLFYFSYEEYHEGHFTDRVMLLYCLSALLCALLYYLARRHYAGTARAVSFSRSALPFLRYFLPFVLIVAVVTGFVAPNLLRDTYSQAWVDWVDASFDNKPEGFLDAEFLSFYQDRDRLGGDIELDDEDRFTVYSNAPVHLRAVVYDYYSGTRWTDTIGRGHSELLENQPMDATKHGTSTKEGYIGPFSLDRPLVTENYDFDRGYNVDGPLKARVFTLKDTRMWTRSIFSVGYTKRATFLTSRNEIRVSDDTSLQTNKRTRGSGENYTVSYLEPDTEELAAYARAYGRAYGTVSPRPEYLQLPDDLPERVVALSRGLSAPFDNAYDACVNMSNYLTTRQVYTTTPGDVPRGYDFVDYFLFENKDGYCVYYASAMVVLARASGYPARYVEGFRIDQYSAGKGATATGKNAHAWAEVYFDGVGWVTFDPITAGEFAGNVELLPDDFQRPEDKPRNKPEDDDEFVPPPPQNNGTEPQQVKDIWWWLRGLGVFLLVAAVIAVFVRRYVITYTSRRWRKIAVPVYRVIPLYRELERAMRFLRLPRAPSQTVGDYLNALAPEFDALEKRLATKKKPAAGLDYAALCRRATQAVYNAAYSETRPSEEDKQALIALTNLAERGVKRKIGPVLFGLWFRSQ